MIFLNINFDFRFGQEVKVKLGSLFVNIFWQLTICTMVQKLWIYLLRLLRYDFFKIFNFDFRFWTGSKGKIRVTFLSIFFDNQRSVQWCKNCEFTSCGCWDMIFLNMTSSWRHKLGIYVLSTCKLSSSEVWSMFFWDNLEKEKNKKRTITICFALTARTPKKKEKKKNRTKTRLSVTDKHIGVRFCHSECHNVSKKICIFIIVHIKE